MSLSIDTPIHSNKFKKKLQKQATKFNYTSLYTLWCTKNNFVPLRWDVLTEIFYGLETQKEYEDTLNALYIIQAEGLKLSFMPADKNNKLVLESRLKIRLELFKRIPSATNMLLAYNLIEELTLKCFQEESKDITDEVNKSIERFDKLKNLALGTKYITERQLAFSRSLEIFKKLTKIKI